ncbi:hypothetical protein D3C76_1300010 [compost metagenome]
MTYSAGVVLPVRSLIRPTITGLTMPPNWPRVLITAIPPAAPAPAPASSFGGRVQKLGMEAMIPAPSRPNATIRKVV